MKKYLAIAMIALASVSASSCDKDNNESSTDYVNTWISENIKATDYLSDDLDDVLKDLPTEAQTAIKAQLANFTFKGVVSISEGGKGYYGVLVNKGDLNLLVSAVTTWVENNSDKLTDEQKVELNKIISALKPTIESLNNNDVVGTDFTWTEKENNGATGVFSCTTKVVEENSETGKTEVKSETLDIAWSGLSANAVTFTYDNQKPVNCKSASAAKVTVGKFYDSDKLFSSIAE